MSMINVNNLTFAYEGSYDTIFENVSFSLDTDWKLGFTGRNGRGKTTFLRLLMGGYPYEGKISATVSFDYFPFEVKDKKQWSVHVVEEICPDYEPWMLSKELSLLEVSEEVLYRNFETLSNGEQTKLLLAALFLKENNFLLIDEPTNHLDSYGRELVSDYLKKKRGFILVSHDRVFLDNCIDHILVIQKSDIEVQKGNFSSWQQNKEWQDGFELAENEKLKKDMKRLTEAARRTAKWSDDIEKTKNGTRIGGLKPDKGHIGAQAAKMMKKSKVAEGRIQRNIEEKESLLKNIERADSLQLRPLRYHAHRVMEGQKLSLYYGDKKICRELDFTVEQGDRIAVAGKNGSGKSSLLKLFLEANGFENRPGGLAEKGQEAGFSGTGALRYEGSLAVGSKLKISYVPQDTSFLRGDLAALAKEWDIDESVFKALLRKLDFSRTQFEKDMADFSGGQKKKVLIAGSLCQRAHIYIWDEPLNFIDVLSRIQIENLILQHNPTMIFVEHDSAFVNAVATKTIPL